MRILAIDPGLTGGVVIYCPNLPKSRRWQVADLPTVGDGPQRRIDAVALYNWIATRGAYFAFVELVAANRLSSRSSSFRFGRAIGAIDAVVARYGQQTTYVTAQKWKKYHGLKGSDKEQSRAKALQLAPELAVHLSRKKDHGRAEAALIALYAKHCLEPIRKQWAADIRASVAAE